jgi:hypothetical protein
MPAAIYIRELKVREDKGDEHQEMHRTQRRPAYTFRLPKEESPRPITSRQSRRSILGRLEIVVESLAAALARCPSAVLGVSQITL